VHYQVAENVPLRLWSMLKVCHHTGTNVHHSYPSKDSGYDPWSSMFWHHTAKMMTTKVSDKPKPLSSVYECRKRKQVSPKLWWPPRRALSIVAILVLQNTMFCQWVNESQHCNGTLCHHLQGSSILRRALDPCRWRHSDPSKHQ